jgi:hypothetical protein
MFSVSNEIKSIAVLLAALAFIGPATSAEESFDPPQVRVSPPGGIAAPSNEPTADGSQAIRILPPGGGPTAVRVSPPIGTRTPARQLSFAELFWLWLQAHARISPPIS